MEKYRKRVNSQTFYYDVHFKIGASSISVSELKAKDEDEALKKAFDIMNTALDKNAIWARR